MKNFKKGFTLAEVLITIGIIGVVAAITIPSLVSSIAERSNSEKEANTVQKINKSMDLMRADGKLLQKYNSTDEFVDELVKYLRVTTRCNAANIAKCWPTAKVKTSDGEEFEVKNTKKGKNLQLKNNTTDNVGLILSDGTPIILTYNENAKLISDGDTVIPGKKPLPIGFGKKKDFVYGSNLMDSIAFVMDVNGSRGPNSEVVGDKVYDIRNFNGARFSTGRFCSTGEIKVGSDVYCDLGQSYPAVDCSSANAGSSDYKAYCGIPSGYTNDYWAGAKKACDDAGYILPDAEPLGEEILALLSKYGGYASGAYKFWTSDEIDKYYVHPVYLFSGEISLNAKNYPFGLALCIAE